jgi:hypothetical protein
LPEVYEVISDKVEKVVHNTPYLLIRV